MKHAKGSGHLHIFVRRMLFPPAPEKPEPRRHEIKRLDVVPLLCDERRQIASHAAADQRKAPLPASVHASGHHAHLPGERQVFEIAIRKVGNDEFPGNAGEALTKRAGLGGTRAGCETMQIYEGHLPCRSMSYNFV